MYRSISSAFMAVAFCIFFAGCGSQPYYKYEGPGQAKKLVVYKKGGNITIDLGSGVGGGVWKFLPKEELRATKGPVVKTVEDQGVKFTLTYNPAGVMQVSVKDVYYEGKQLKSW